MSQENITPPAPEAKINLGDQERTLRCDMYAMRLYKQETGESLMKQGAELALDEDSVPILLWAFCRHEDPDFTVDDAAKLVHPGNMLAVVERITDLIGESLPEVPETDKNDEHTDEEDADGEGPLAVAR